MIDINKAIELFEAYEHEYVGTIFDVWHSFIMVSVDEYGDVIEVSPIAINKKTGKMTDYFPPDHWGELEKAKKINIRNLNGTVN